MHPLKDISVHVKQAEGVRLFLSHRFGLMAVLVRNPGSGRQSCGIITGMELRGRPGAAGKFPLSLSGQSIAANTGLGYQIRSEAIGPFQSFALAELITKFHAVDPGPSVRLAGFTPVTRRKLS